MPFKSQAQRRKFAELLVQGKITPETFEEWNRETGGAKLPERAHRKPSRNTAARRSAKKKTRKKKAAKKTTARKTTAKKRIAKKTTAKKNAPRRVGSGRRTSAAKSSKR